MPNTTDIELIIDSNPIAVQVDLTSPTTVLQVSVESDSPSKVVEFQSTDPTPIVIKAVVSAIDAGQVATIQALLDAASTSAIVTAQSEGVVAAIEANVQAQQNAINLTQAEIDNTAALVSGWKNTVEGLQTDYTAKYDAVSTWHGEVNTLHDQVEIWEADVALKEVNVLAKHADVNIWQQQVSADHDQVGLWKTAVDVAQTDVLDKNGNVNVKSAAVDAAKVAIDLTHTDILEKYDAVNTWQQEVSINKDQVETWKAAVDVSQADVILKQADVVLKFDTVVASEISVSTMHDNVVLKTAEALQYSNNVTSQLVYLGPWDLATNGLPPLPDGAPFKHVFYRLTTSGTVDGEYVVAGDEIGYDYTNSVWYVLGRSQDGTWNISNFDPELKADITYVDSQDLLKFDKTGGALTGEVTVNGDKVYHAGDFTFGTTANANTLAQRDSAGRLMGKAYTRESHHTGHLEGSYDNVGNNGTKSNPIYTIGSNYNPTDAALGGMFGIGYTDLANATFAKDIAGRPSGWGMYAAANGSVGVMLGASFGEIWAKKSLYLGTTGTGNEGIIYLNSYSTTAGVKAQMKCTNGNLHLDAATGGYATYLNFYTGTQGVAFGTGTGAIAAWMGSDGDLWKGSSDNTGSKYWHAGNLPDYRASGYNGALVNDGGITKLMRWKNYGLSHTIFDASAGTSPEGDAISNSVPTSAWTATYPTLMGWNGSQSYGVKVNRADLADVATWADTVDVNTSTAAAYYPVVWNSGDTLYQSNSSNEFKYRPSDGHVLIDHAYLGNYLAVNTSGHLHANNTNGRQAGVYGLYDSNRTGHIWSMGTSYKIHASGTDFGNLYGLAYKHTNNGTGGTMAGSHQMVWCENGTAKCAMGTNLWTSGTVYEGGTALNTRYLGISANAATASWADTVDVNTSTSNADYNVCWHSGDTVYGSNGKLKLNPSSGNLTMVSFTVTSDENLKDVSEVINPQYAAEILDQIDVIRYDFKDGSLINQIGFSAQAFERAGCPEVVKTNAEGIKSLDYRAVAVLHQAARKHDLKRIAAIESRLDKAGL